MGIEVIKDEADKRQYDPFRVVGKKPGFRYKLLNKSSRNIERRLHEGYEIVQGDDPERLDQLGPSNPMKKGADVDSTRQVSDLVLARIPEALVQEKARKVKEATERQTGRVKAAFHQATGEHGFDESTGGGGRTGYNEGRLG